MRSPGVSSAPPSPDESRSSRRASSISSGSSTSSNPATPTSSSTQSGGIILANLLGSTADVDKQGRPTHLNFVVDGGGGSGGIYASSAGSGTVDIRYTGGSARVLVQGSIFTQGIGGALAVFQSNSHH